MYTKVEKPQWILTWTSQYTNKIQTEKLLDSSTKRVTDLVRCKGSYCRKFPRLKGCWNGCNKG